MKNKSFTYKYSILLLFCGLFMFTTSCKKDKVSLPLPVPEATKWEKIAGTYKVYDTLGAYLYQMNISHVPSGVYNNDDSLKFENFDGEFTFTSIQTSFSNNPELLIRIGYHEELFDSNLYSFKLLTASNPDFYYNVLDNDTIRLIFRKTNINYYLYDNVPYYYCECKQIAVKQH